MIDIQISHNPLDPEKCLDWAAADDVGCVNIFVGKVRREANNRKVLYLEFEVYEGMALSEMEKIAKDAQEKWNVERILIHHREGRVEAGEVPVVIAVSARHRREAIKACHYIIDTLKATVPIWKKEVFEGGEEWVSAHP